MRPNLQLALAAAALVMVALAACGEMPFNGSRFEVTMDGTTQTFKTKQAVAPCNQDNSDEYDNYEVRVSESGSVDDPFVFQIENTDPGTYYSQGPKEFELDMQFDEGDVTREYVTWISCDGARMSFNIEGQDHGLTHGTATGEICSFIDEKRRDIEIEFAFAVDESGSCGGLF